MASTSQGSKCQSTKSGTARMEQVLKKAGGAQPSGPGLDPFPKHTDAKEKKAVDYRQEAFPPPTLRIVQPVSE